MPSPLADSEVDARDLRRDLTTAIVEHHSKQFADQMARELVQRDEEDVLVALVKDCSGAVLHHPVAKSLDVMRFDADGIDWDGIETLKEYTVDPARWVHEHPAEVDWVHPRYRWVL